MHSFSIQEALWFGWEKLRAHSRLVFEVVLTILGLEVLQAIVSRTLAGTALGFVSMVVLFVLEFLAGIGATRIALKLARGERSIYADIVPPWELAWRYLLASLLAALIIVLGLIALIIPGMYFMLRFFFVRFAIIDGARVIESLGLSSTLTGGHKWHLLGFFIVIVLLNIVGALLLIVGLLVTLPVSMLAMAQVYLILKGADHPHAHSH